MRKFHSQMYSLSSSVNMNRVRVKSTCSVNIFVEYSWKISSKNEYKTWKKLKFIYRLDGSIILIFFMPMQTRILGFLLSSIKYLYGDVSDHWVKTIDLQYVGNNWNLFWRRFISSSSTDMTFIYQYVSAFQKLTLNITFPIILSYILFHVIYLCRQFKNYY